MTKICPINELTPDEMQEISCGLQNGAVVAIPTDTVYGLAANAFEERAIERIYEIKQRPASMALQILVGNIAQAKQLVVWNDWAEKLARAYWPGALTLILRPSPAGVPLLRGFEGLGLRVPAHEALCRLLSALPFPLACTSANLHGQPVCTQAEQIIALLQGKADYILTDGTLQAMASSVVSVMDEPKLLRQGALSKIALEKTLATVLK